MEYVLSKGNFFIIPSRIYFHLVENKDNDEFPFAFLATYTAIENGKLIHCPLKNALTQLKSDKNKLSALVSSITEATKESALIKKFVESGNIFYPIKLSEHEAYSFLKEISLYERCGIVCKSLNGTLKVFQKFKWILMNALSLLFIQLMVMGFLFLK
jgi:non-specific serine/threonine protein kinase